MNFASDNIVGVHPAVLQALVDANEGPQAAYGEDDHTAQAVADLSRVFETDLEAYLVATGTAANSLSLAALAPPFGAVFCHADAHIAVDECGAPEFFTGGAKLFGLDGPGGKITPALVAATLDGFVKGVHDPLPSAISITQATELGTLYTPDEIRALADLAHSHDMGLHMDGARFANALVALGCTPAAITWEAGVDILSFGGTKNGAMALEAVVLFEPHVASSFNHRRMKAGQLLSKGRYLGAQLGAYLAEDLWLHNARHANAMAAKLSAGLADIRDVRLPLPTAANEVFPIMPRPLFDRLHQAGAAFYEWPGNGPGTDSVGTDEVFARLVCAFTTTEEEVEAFVAAARTAADA